MSQSAIRITSTLAFLTGVMLGFQNCTLSKFTGQGSDVAASNTSTPTTNGGFDGNNGGAPAVNGGGFDGKAFIHVGQCSGQRAVDTVVLVDTKGSTANFLRSNCIDQPLPYANRIGELDVSGMAVGAIVILADNTLLNQDPDVTTESDGKTQLPAAWPVPKKWKVAEILCTPNIVSNYIPVFSIYSYDGASYFADIRYPRGAGPVPTPADLSAGICDTNNLDAFLGVPFQAAGAPAGRGGGSLGGANQSNSQSFSSIDQMFAFTAAQNLFSFSASDITGVYTATNLNCYSELPGWAALMMSNNLPPLPNPASLYYKVSSVDGGSSGKDSSGGGK